MIDVHVLTMSTTPSSWGALCIASIEHAIDNAGYPVHLHVTKGVPGHIGQARAKGYSFGTQPYVTHVDHDDYVHEDAFKVLLPFFGAEAITTGETIVFEDAIAERPKSRHHLAVFKRSFIESLSLQNFQHFPDQYALHEAKAIHIEQCLYFHRVYASSGSRKLREETPEQAKQELRAFRGKFSEVEMLTPLQLKVLLDRELRHA